MAVHHLTSTISCHAWNADRTMLALCPNTSEVWIYTGCGDADCTKWVKTWTLKEHDLTVSGIDWHPVTNKIVTCAHDRNVFVWNYDESKKDWKATVVIAGIERAALDVKWSPDGLKFALASSNKNVMLCWYDDAGNWYINRVCKKEKAKTTAKSSVVSLAWHPNNQVLAASSTDYKCRVLFAYLETTDSGGPNAAPFADGASLEPGETIMEWEQTRAWVNDAAWSPSGNQLAFVGHDGLLHVVSFLGAAPAVASVKTSGLPASKVLWVNEKSLVTAGHNMNPDIFALDGGKWAYVGSADVKDAAGSGPRASSTFGAAHAMFAARTLKGTTAEAAGETGTWTKHQGAITCLQPVARSARGLTKFSTSGSDGRLVVWDLPGALPAATLGL